MADPLALVTLALAAAGGRFADQEVSALVAAGHALLQRSALLVRALGTARSALALPVGGPWPTALAASDGRGALLLDPTAEAGAVRDELTRHGVGALFTVESLARTWSDAIPAEVVQVWLDDVPRHATVWANGAERRIELGSHFGLSLAGDRESEGLDEPFVWVDGGWHSHRAVLAAARALAADRQLTPMHAVSARSHWTYAELLDQLSVLLQGGRVAAGDGVA